MIDISLFSGEVQGDSVSGEVTSSGELTGAVVSDDVMSGDIMHTVLKGISAYQDAVNHGFVGTEEEWLASLGATITVGTVTTGDTVSVTNSGTPHDAIFDFVIPAGGSGTADIAHLTQSETVIFNCGSATEVV